MRVTITVHADNAGNVEVDEFPTRPRHLSTPDAEQIEQLLIAACAKVRGAYGIKQEGGAA